MAKNGSILLAIDTTGTRYRIQYNDISYDDAECKGDKKHYGYQLEPKTVEFLSDVVNQLRRLEKTLREYDLAVSGDTCETTFQERVGIK